MLITNHQGSGAATTTARAQEELSSLAGAESGGEGGSSGSESESESEEKSGEGKRRSKRGGRSRTSLGPRTLGDVEEEGFTGTRMGYQVQKVREVAEVSGSCAFPSLQAPMSAHACESQSKPEMALLYTPYIHYSHKVSPLRRAGVTS